MTTLKDFIKWNEDKWETKNKEMYTQSDNENTWPWFSKELDSDVIDFIGTDKITSTKILDLGTCSGTQAIALAKMGYDVVGTDVSTTALNQAIELAKDLPAETKLEFLIDDILDTKLNDEQFDLIIDRGCFHSICCISTKKYIACLKRLLKPGGKIILKTMSLKEQRFVGYDTFAGQQIPMPYRFDEEILRNIFSAHFTIEKIEDSFFYSSVVNPPAQAILTILSNKISL
ncbi:MAG: class I SAM-dependent methyltransferase [Alteromonadaceae bacterium]|nr:class I SAM-dependent methyltransferase [Alteromonadaceae bacterium]